MRDWILETIARYIPPFFFGTLLAAAFGAFAGAWAASRRETKRAAVVELNCISSALMLCFAICNRMIGLKSQLVRPMAERYKRSREKYEAGVRAGREIELHADLQTITPIRLPTEVLERYIFEKISIRGRALAAAVDLVGAIDGLDKAIKSRNDLIAEFQRSSPVPPKALAEKYFGLKRADGVADQKYSSGIAAIVNQTDDCIFFSRILADDLREYGKQLQRRHAWRLRLGLPKIAGSADWSEAERQGLIPSRDQYERWLRGFQKKPSRFRRVADWVRSRLAKIRTDQRLRGRRRRLRDAWRADRRT